MFARIGRDGLIGFGEAYQAGDWTAPDLAATLTVFARRMERLVPVPLQRLRGWYVARHPEDDRNTRSGSRTNIARHYDLSNDLFEAFLDRSMTYSAALFDADRLDGRAVWEELTPAQHAKIDRLLDLAHVGAGTQLLEIGTGWGELAIRAAQRGATVRSVTLSAEQRDLARVRARLAGVADRVTIDVGDYRDLTGRYDAVVSVEMIEAVGWEFLPGYFEQLERLLAPGGRIAVQAITMADHRMQATLDTYTWVHKYIFPGGMIPSPETIRDRAVAVGLTIVDDLAFGAHYTETLRLWEERFLNRWPRIAALGFDATFQRTWHFYLAYSRAGFASGYLDVHQYAMVRASDHRSLVDPGGC